MKQQCESEQFIVIKDYMKRVARDFMSNRKMGEREQDSGETERVSEKQSIAGRGR